jgi:hypothetical protein
VKPEIHNILVGRMICHVDVMYAIRLKNGRPIRAPGDPIECSLDRLIGQGVVLPPPQFG